MKMKKRFSDILLSLVMVLGLMPVMSLTAKADNYYLWVGGTQVTSENMSDVFSDGKVSYTPAQGTTAAKLKLNGYNYEGEGHFDLDEGCYYAIWTKENLIIELSGTNSIKNTQSSSYAIYSGGSLSITGNAVLNVEGTESGISSQSLTVDGGDITAKGTNQDGIRSQGPIQINNGKVNATSNGGMSSGLSSGGTITINGGSVTANCDGTPSNGILAGDIYINGGNVIASGTNCGINVINKVINKIPGKGWTNTEGTEGENGISVSTAGQSLASYKKVSFQAVHTHSFTYSASGATITATCTEDGCTLPPSSQGGTDHVAKLTIAAPTLETYGETGKSADATLTGLADFNTATSKTIEATNIKYVGRGGTSYAESATAPTNAGKYTAKITLSGVKTSAGDNQSVTASVDYEIARAATSVTTQPTAAEITYGKTLADSILTGGAASISGTFTWKDSTVVPAVTDSQKTEYDVVFTPTDRNYGAAECKVKLTVNKATATETAPTPKTLTYTGSAQELVNAGSTKDGTLYYAVTTENKVPTDESLYTTSIPTVTNTGTYYVWYKVMGDANHNDTEPGCVEVNIVQKETEKQTESEKQSESEKQTEKQDTTLSVGGGGGSLPQAQDPAPTTTPSETVEQPTTTGDPTITQDAFTGVSEVIETSTDGTASVTSVSGTTDNTLRITGTVNQGGTNYPVSSFATESFGDVDVKNIFIDLKASGNNTQTVTFQPRTFKGSEAKKLTLRLTSSRQVKFSSGAMSGSKIKKVVVSGLKKKEFKRVEKKLRKSGYKGKIVKK